ncbi:hypothetical protein MMC11_008082 [Xylographa trunciseda]|nr:hypothetical protein [Xylographa trunciseda]
MSSRCIARLSTTAFPHTHLLPTLSTTAHLFHNPPVRHSSSSRSPKVRKAEWARKQHPTAQKQSSPRTWPTSLLVAAYREGRLPLVPTRATDALEAFATLTKYNRPSKSAVQKWGEEHLIRPMTMTILARILLSAGEREHFPLVRELLLSASALDDEAATITLVHQAVETGKTQHPDIVAPRAHLVRLAAAGSPAAMVLQAELLAAQGQTQKALAMCEEAVQKNADAYTGAEAIGETKRKAWSTLAQLRKHLGEADGARVALEKGALEHDDPWAYYHLAHTYRSPADPEYLHFMLKAAASGVPDAANKLGRFYLGLAAPSTPTPAPKDGAARTGRGAAPYVTPSSDREKQLLALEWFSVSAAHPQSRSADDSQVFLALLLRGQGAREEGRAVLQRAGASAVYGPHAVPWLLARWDGTRDFLTAAFLGTGLERVVKGVVEGG